MLEEIYERDEELTEDAYYDALLFLLGDIYPDLSEDELEDVLEDLLDQMPERYADSVLDTIGAIGKKGLKFAAANPKLVKGVLKTAGAIVGGPVGAKIGDGLGNIITKTGQNKMMPETGKALGLMQNPQAQAALARTTMGLGDGTAPLSLNGRTLQIPAALYLRAMVSVAQAALKEIDRNNVIPPAAYSESLPFADDLDMQAEWLAESLLEEYTESRPLTTSELGILFSQQKNQVGRLVLLHKLKKESEKIILVINSSDILDVIKSNDDLEFLKNQISEIKKISNISISNGVVKFKLVEGNDQVKLKVALIVSIIIEDDAIVNVKNLSVNQSKLKDYIGDPMVYDISGSVPILGIKSTFLGGIDATPQKLTFIKSEIVANKKEDGSTFDTYDTKVNIYIKEPLISNRLNQLAGWQSLGKKKQKQSTK